MAGMFLARDATFSSLGVGAILVVAVAVLGSLTVLPALLAKLGRWVDRPRIPFLWRLTDARTGSRASGRRCSPVAAPPAPVLGIAAALSLLALAAPALGMTLKLPAPPTCRGRSRS